MISFQINFSSFCIYLYSKCTQEKTHKPTIQRTIQVLCFPPGFSFFYACVNSWMHSPMTLCPGCCFHFSMQISHYRVEKSLRKSRGQTWKTLSAYEGCSFLCRSDGETVKILRSGGDRQVWFPLRWSFCYSVVDGLAQAGVDMKIKATTLQRCRYPE